MEARWPPPFGGTVAGASFMDTGLAPARTRFGAMEEELLVEKEPPLVVPLESDRLMDKRLHLRLTQQSNSG